MYVLTRRLTRQNVRDVFIELSIDLHGGELVKGVLSKYIYVVMLLSSAKACFDLSSLAIYTSDNHDNDVRNPGSRAKITEDTSS